MAKQNVSVTINKLDKSKGEVMDANFFELIQNNFKELATKTGQINQFEQLDHVEPLDESASADDTARAVNALLADLQAKGYMQ